jgi:hypothetical protein
MLLCTILAASLGVQLLPGGISSGQGRESVRILAVASAPAVHANSGARRFEPSKHRNAAGSPFPALRADGFLLERSCSAIAVRERGPHSTFTAGPQSGRSPPRNS